MEEKLFKQALDFIKKYEITSYVIAINPNSSRFSNPIRIQGYAFENYKAMMELDGKWCEEDGWYTYSERDIDLTLTVE